MSDITRTIMIASVIIACVISCLFVLGYSSIEASNAEWTEISLPNGTRAVNAAAPWAFAIPIILGVVSFLYRKSDLAAAIVCGWGGIFVIAWPLLCIFVWKQPYQIFGAIVV